MKTQTIVSYLCVLSLCLLSFGVTQDLDDDDSTVVTTEEEENSIDEDIVYESPMPTGNVYLAEHFDDLDKFKKKWVLSEAKKEDIDENIAKYDGVWEVESPVKDGLKGDMGLVLKSKAKHAAISARLDKPFTFVEKPLIVQYEVVLQEGQECGGAYLKLLSAGKDTSDLRNFHDKTPYTIMFGPDKCGNDHKLHFIFRHKNPKNGTLTEKHCKKSKDRLEEPFKDKQPHLYTLVIKPDNSYTISLDRKVINEGNLLDDFTPPVNPPAEIDDPDDKKPENWDEREKIPDPEAQKPDDWDEDAPAMIPDTASTKPDGWLEDESEMISDPTAEKPDDWDSDMDGDWEAPLIPNPVCESAPGCGPWKAPLISNPNYKGKWRAPMIENPNYKGKWKPRRIPNPDFFEDKTPFRMTTISAVGFELWSMSNMILFDNIIITDDALVAERWALDTFSLKRRKIDKDSETMWEQVMRSINYKPGWWGLYFVYCIIPVAAYVWYLYSRVAEESLLMRLVKYTNEQPWLWAVYVVVIGLPVVLVIVFCCGSSNKEKEEQRRAAEAKKTDAMSPDDEPEDEVDMRPRNPVASSKSDLEVPEEKEENDDIGDQKNNKEDGESQSDVEEEANHTGAGDAPRSPKKRRPRRE